MDASYAVSEEDNPHAAAARDADADEYECCTAPVASGWDCEVDILSMDIGMDCKDLVVEVGVGSIERVGDSSVYTGQLNKFDRSAQEDVKRHENDKRTDSFGHIRTGADDCCSSAGLRAAVSEDEEDGVIDFLTDEGDYTESVGTILPASDISMARFWDANQIRLYGSSHVNNSPEDQAHDAQHKPSPKNCSLSAVASLFDGRHMQHFSELFGNVEDQRNVVTSDAGSNGDDHADSQADEGTSLAMSSQSGKKTWAQLLEDDLAQEGEYESDVNDDDHVNGESDAFDEPPDDEMTSSCQSSRAEAGGRTSAVLNDAGAGLDDSWHSTEADGSTARDKRDYAFRNDSGCSVQLEQRWLAAEEGSGENWCGDIKCTGSTCTDSSNTSICEPGRLDVDSNTAPEGFGKTSSDTVLALPEWFSPAANGETTIITGNNAVPASSQPLSPTFRRQTAEGSSKGTDSGQASPTNPFWPQWQAGSFTTISSVSAADTAGFASSSSCQQLHTPTQDVSSGMPRGLASTSGSQQSLASTRVGWRGQSNGHTDLDIVAASAALSNSELPSMGQKTRVPSSWLGSHDASSSSLKFQKSLNKFKTIIEGGQGQAVLPFGEVARAKADEQLWNGSTLAKTAAMMQQQWPDGGVHAVEREKADVCNDSWHVVPSAALLQQQQPAAVAGSGARSSMPPGCWPVDIRSYISGNNSRRLAQDSSRSSSVAPVTCSVDHPSKTAAVKSVPALASPFAIPGSVTQFVPGSVVAGTTPVGTVRVCEGEKPSWSPDAQPHVVGTAAIKPGSKDKASQSGSPPVYYRRPSDASQSSTADAAGKVLHRLSTKLTQPLWPMDEPGRVAFQSCDSYATTHQPKKSVATADPTSRVPSTGSECRQGGASGRDSHGSTCKVVEPDAGCHNKDIGGPLSASYQLSSRCAETLARDDGSSSPLGEQNNPAGSPPVANPLFHVPSASHSHRAASSENLSTSDALRGTARSFLSAVLCRRMSGDPTIGSTSRLSADRPAISTGSPHRLQSVNEAAATAVADGDRGFVRASLVTRQQSAASDCEAGKAAKASQVGHGLGQTPVHGLGDSSSAGSHHGQTDCIGQNSVTAGSGATLHGSAAEATATASRLPYYAAAEPWSSVVATTWQPAARPQRVSVSSNRYGVANAADDVDAPTATAAAARVAANDQLRRPIEELQPLPQAWHSRAPAVASLSFSSAFHQEKGSERRWSAAETFEEAVPTASLPARQAARLDCSIAGSQEPWGAAATHRQLPGLPGPPSGSTAGRGREAALPFSGSSRSGQLSPSSELAAATESSRGGQLPATGWEAGIRELEDMYQRACWELHIGELSASTVRP